MIGLLSLENKSRKISVLVMAAMMLLVPVAGVVSFSGTVQADDGDSYLFVTEDTGDTSGNAIDTNEDGSIAYVGNAAGDVIAVKSDGTQKWTWSIGSGVQSLYYDEADDVVYAGTQNSNVLRYDPSTDSSTTIYSGSGYIDEIEPYNGDLVVQDGSDAVVMSQDGTVDNTYTLDDYPNGLTVDDDTDTLYYGDSGNDMVKGLDLSDGTEVFSYSISGTVVNDVAWSDSNDVLYFAKGSGDTTVGVDVSDGSKVYGHAHKSDDAKNVNVSDKHVFTTYDQGWVVASPKSDDTTTSFAYQDTTSSQDGAMFESDSKHLWVGGVGGTFGYDTTKDISYSKTVSGQVTDQSNSGISNAKVDVYAVDHNNISTDEDTSTLQERAKEILNESSNIDPPTSYDPKYDLKKAANNQSATYVGVHTKSDWNKGFAGDIDQVDIDEPVIVHENANNPVVLSVWDATGSAIIQDNIDKQMPGATVKSPQEIEITKLGPDGDSINSYTVETTEYKNNGFALVAGSTHYAVPVKLNSGFYRVEHVTDEDTISYVVAVEPEKQMEIFADDLKDKADNLSDRASYIAQLKSDNKVSKIETTTDSNGNFSVDVPSSMKTVGIVAYKGAEVDVTKNTTVADLRDNWEANEESVESIYMTKEPTIVEPAATGVDVKVQEISNPNFADIATSISKWNFIQDYLDKEALSDIGGTTKQQIQDKSSEVKDRLLQSYNDLLAQNPAIDERYNELVEEHPKSEENLTDEEKIALMEEAINSFKDTTSVDEENVTVDVNVPDSWEDPDQTIDENTAPVDMTIPFEGNLNQDNIESVVVTAYHSDGSTHVLKDDQYSIDGSMFSSGAVVIEDYQLPSDVHAVTFDVTVSGEETVGDTEQTVENPRPDLGEVPEIKAVDLNTISPEAGEEVVLDVKSDDAAFQSVSAVRAYAPDGTEVTATKSNGEFRFTPNQQGAYLVEMDVKNAAGETVTQTVQLKSNENNVNWPENVRISKTQTGPVAIAGDGVESASFEMSGSQATISMEVGKDAPTELNVYAANAIERADTDITVRVTDSSGQLTDGHQIVNVYSARMSDDAIVYRGNEPVAEGTRYGSIIDSDSGTVIKTYTSGGEATINVDNDPGFIEQQQYELEVWLAQSDIPFVGGDN